jgi:two-component system phosphate regulon sensor histidine kinase PhoR
MRYLSYGVMLYMLLALIWWTIFLLKFNDNLYEVKMAIAEKRTDLNYAELTTSDVIDRFNKNKGQIYGEGIVFGLSLILGLYFIQRAYINEIATSRKQNNFLLSITHELKSPLAAIRLTADTIKRRKVSDDQKVELCDQIIEENTRLQNLVSNLLLTSRINQAYQYHFEQVDVNVLLQTVLQSINIQYPKAKLDINSQKLPKDVHADKESFISLMRNLVENAVKYSPAQDDISISINHYDGQNYKITISDKGIGIADAEKPKIFQQFYRTGQEETRTTKGTGLGLYIVARIVKAYSGKLSVSNNSPKGSIFKIILPYHPGIN